MANTYWERRDCGEELTHSDPDDAIESIIDSMHPTPIEEIGDIEVLEYAPMKAEIRAGSVLELTLDLLDENYGGEDCTEPTDAMKLAENAFIEIILSEYTAYQCAPTGKSITVNALEWTKEHCPEWLSGQNEGDQC